MPLPFDWHLIDPFPVESAGSPAWSSTLERMIVISGVDVYYSDDGITWTLGTSPSATHGIMFPIWNGSQSKFCGIIWNSGPGRYYGCSSVDGITWSYGGEITTSILNWGGLACSSGGRLLAISIDGHCFRSDDAGSSWTEAGADLITIDSSIDTYWSPVSWHPVGVFIALNFGSGQTADIPIATSPDGITWTGRRGFEPTYQQDWYYITYDSDTGYMFAISQNNGVIMKSANGTTWDYVTELTTHFPGVGRVEVQGFLYSADLGHLIVFNWDTIDALTEVLVSDDSAITWTQDSGVLPPYMDLNPLEANDWFNIFEAPELERFFGFSGTSSSTPTPVVTSPAYNGNGGGEIILIELEGDGGLELGEEGADIAIAWAYTGSGGLEFGGGGPDTFVVSVDSSGLYTPIPGQRFDRIYTRIPDLDSTEDVALPDPFIKTAYLGS